MCSQAGHFVHKPSGISRQSFSEKPFHVDFACFAISCFRTFVTARPADCNG